MTRLVEYDAASAASAFGTVVVWIPISLLGVAVAHGLVGQPSSSEDTYLLPPLDDGDAWEELLAACRSVAELAGASGVPDARWDRDRRRVRYWRGASGFAARGLGITQCPTRRG